MTNPTEQTEKETAKKGWIIITPTVCQGDIPAYWEENEEGLRVPVTYPTLREAYKEIADTQIMKLQEFLDNEDLAEDEVPEFEPEDYVLPCEIYPNGVIKTEEHGIFYDGVPTEE